MAARFSVGAVTVSTPSLDREEEIFSGLTPLGRQGKSLLELFRDVGLTSLSLGLVLRQHDQHLPLGLNTQLLKYLESSNKINRKD